MRDCLVESLVQMAKKQRQRVKGTAFVTPILLDPVAMGKKGGKHRWIGVSKEERSRLARAAANVRWATARKQQGK